MTVNIYTDYIYIKFRTLRTRTDLRESDWNTVSKCWQGSERWAELTFDGRNTKDFVYSTHMVVFHKIRVREANEEYKEKLYDHVCILTRYSDGLKVDRLKREIIGRITN